MSDTAPKDGTDNGATTPASDDATKAAEAAAAAKPASDDGGKTFTQADIDRIVADRLARQKAQFGDYDDLKTKAAELEELRKAQMTKEELLASELEAANKRIEAAEAAKAKVELDALRARIATEHKLPAALAGRLTGTNEEELKADAAALVAAIPAVSTGSSPTDEDGILSETPADEDPFLKALSK